MIRSLQDLGNCTFEGEDGELGRVRDFYFDDVRWTVRYLVLETGRWLPGRRVLVSPEAVTQTDTEKGRIRLGLTKEKIENAPTVAEDQPVSRQQEKALHQYYGWSPYWLAGPSALEAAVPLPPSETPGADDAPSNDAAAAAGDPHLRSFEEIRGYGVVANDGSIGEVFDLACEDETWVVRYLMIDTRKWLPGRQVLVAPDWVRRFEWAKGEVQLDLTKDRLKSSPIIEPGRPITREDEEKLYAAHDRPRYWRREKRSQA